MHEEVERLLADQIRYYDDRSAEYEDLWHRRGRHDLGPDRDRRWFEETAMLEAVVDALDASGSVLELACGTGLWTRRLSPRASRYVAVDASPAMLEINRKSTAGANVEYVEADVFSWNTRERFDLVIIGFFVSHVPPVRFAGFWDCARGWLAPGGIVFVCDDAAGPDRPYSGDRVPGGPEFAHRRRLAGGREYEIVKVFYSPEELRARLAGLRWSADVRSSGEHFLFGTATPASPQRRVSPVAASKR